jgi:streptomycin 6-kinase
VSVKPLLADPVFPGLGVAIDPELMRGVFANYLRPLRGGTYRVTDCRLFRVRYRRGTGCVLQYTLRLADSDTGDERIQWVTGVMYAKDRTRRVWEKLQASYRREVPDGSSAFEPFTFIADLGMLMEVFPYDRRLPTLTLVMAGPPPELEHPLLASFGPGDWQTEAWKVELIRYRAELAATLRFTVQARDDTVGRTDARRFYAKVYRDEGGERTYRALQALRSRADEDNEKFTVAAPIAYLSELKVLLQEETLGTSLQEMIVQEGDASPAVRKAAEALAALHLEHIPTPQRHPLPNEVAALERTGTILRWACPHLGAEIEETVGAVVASLEEVPPVPTHRDLKLDHILLDGDRLSLVDLDNFAEADPVLDVANVLAHLKSMPFRFPLTLEDSWSTAAQVFAEEYFSHVPRSWRRRLPIHYAGAVLKFSVGFFGRQELDWPGRIATLLEEAKASLAGRVW